PNGLPNSLPSLGFGVRQRRDCCFGCPYEVGRGKQNLDSANSGRNGYHFEQLDRLVDVNWICLLCCERGYSTSDIACQFLPFLDEHEMHLTSAGSRRKRLKVQFCIGWNDCHADAVPIALGNQRFEKLFRRQTDFDGNGLGCKIVGIDFVYAQLVADSHLVQETDSIGFLRHCPSSPLVSSCLVALATGNSGRRNPLSEYHECKCRRKQRNKK